MSKPRIFVSSTFYDLMHIRDSMGLFIESLGYEAILSEKGRVPYIPNRNLDDSCYEAIKNIDMFVLIIGGRRGSQSSANIENESVVQKEFKTAIELGIPVYTLVFKDVYSEYRTFLKNKENNSSVLYAHVDDVSLFEFIEDIKGKRRDLPIHSFSNFQDIEEWLKKQWAGLLYHLLDEFFKRKEEVNILEEIDSLKEREKTTQSYLELLMEDADIDERKQKVKDEKGRIKKLVVYEKIKKTNPFVRYLNYKYGIDSKTLLSKIEDSKSHKVFVDELCKELKENEELRADLDKEINKKAVSEARLEMGLPKYK